MTAPVDISRERLELLHSMGGVDYIHLALRAALDAAEADKAAAVEALTELLAVSLRAVRLSADHLDFKLYAMEPMHQAIAAAIRAGAKP